MDGLTLGWRRGLSERRGKQRYDEIEQKGTGVLVRSKVTGII